MNKKAYITTTQYGADGVARSAREPSRNHKADCSLLTLDFVLLVYTIQPKTSAEKAQKNKNFTNIVRIGEKSYFTFMFYDGLIQERKALNSLKMY